MFMSRLIKPVSLLTLAGFLLVSLPLPGHAALVGTEQLLNTASAEHDRLLNALKRDDVKQQLLAYGVSPATVEARLAGLTYDEARQLADNVESLPAGGESILGLAVFIFLVLLLTDILGYTDIFPFVKKDKK
jgi:hypothetical protein